MLDYQAIAALAAIIESQSFIKAAEKLFITQSAVSQRIRALESHYGEPVLIRALPYRPTALGLTLLRHFKRTQLLENALEEELGAQTLRQSVSIAISRDSLETWFVKVIDGLKTLPELQLEIIADDQDATLNYFQNGQVAACASTEPKPASGARAEFLGYFDYVLVASPEFKKRYFKQANDRLNLTRAPALIFDHKDQLHFQYLRHFFKISDEQLRYHTVPSVAGFRQFAIQGYAYALIPRIDIIQELGQHKLVILYPDKILKMPVFWHSWAIETRLYKQFNALVIKTGKKLLSQQEK